MTTIVIAMPTTGVRTCRMSRALLSMYQRMKIVTATGIAVRTRRPAGPREREPALGDHVAIRLPALTDPDRPLEDRNCVACPAGCDQRLAERGQRIGDPRVIGGDHLRPVRDRFSQVLLGFRVAAEQRQRLPAVAERVAEQWAVGAVRAPQHVELLLKSIES